MALPVCTFCEQYEGVYMGTNLADGDTQVICAYDMPAFALGMAAAVTEGMTKVQADQYGESLDAIYAHDPRAPQRPAAKAKAKAKQPPPPQDPPDSAQSDAAVTVALVPPCDQCGSTTATGDAHKLVCNECGAVIATADDSNPDKGA
jgi:hypothetical protein